MFWLAFVLSGVEAARLDDAELNVLDARQALRSGRLTVESVDFVAAESGGALGPDRTIVYEMWFDGDALRTTQTAGRAQQDGSLGVFAKEDGLRREGRTLRREYDLANPGEPLAVPVALIDDSAYWLKFQKHVFDPRLMGLKPVPFGILHASTLEGFVGNPNRETTTAEDTELDGEPVRLVTYTHRGATARMWIAVDRGWNLLRSEYSVPKLHHDVTLTCELAQFGDVWFPRQVVFEEFDRDGNLAERNVATVKRAEFNVPIDPEQFTLAGLNPVKGSILFNAAEPAKTFGRWDGEALVPVGEGRSDAPAELAEPPANPARKYILWGNVAAGAILLLVYLRIRKSKAA